MRPWDQLLDHPRINLPDRRKAETNPLFSTRGGTNVTFPPSLALPRCRDRARFNRGNDEITGLLFFEEHPRREDVLLMRSSRQSSGIFFFFLPHACVFVFFTEINYFELFRSGSFDPIFEKFSKDCISLYTLYRRLTFSSFSRLIRTSPALYIYIYIFFCIQSAITQTHEQPRAFPFN